MSPEYAFYGKEPPTALSIIRLKSNEAGPQYGNLMYPQLSVGRFEGDIWWPASHIPSPPIVFVFVFALCLLVYMEERRLINILTHLMKVLRLLINILRRLMKLIRHIERVL